MRAELETSRRERASEQEQLAQALQPQGNIPILNLDAERSAGSPGNEPRNRLRQPASGRVVLALPVDPPFQRSYRAILRDARGREVARVEDLHPGERDSLTLSLPASLMPPGDYFLSIDGLTSGGKPTAAGRFPFRILAPT